MAVSCNIEPPLDKINSNSKSPIAFSHTSLQNKSGRNVPGVVAHTSNPCTLEAGALRLLCIQGQPGLPSWTVPQTKKKQTEQKNSFVVYPCLFYTQENCPY